MTTASGLLALVLAIRASRKEPWPGASRLFGRGVGCLASLVGGLIGLFMGLVVSVLTIAPSGSALEYIAYEVIMALSGIGGALFAPVQVYLVGATR